MRITVFAAGSRGDVQPAVALGRALIAAGYAVTLAAPADFKDFIEQHGVPCHPLRGDVQAIMAGETGRRFMERGSLNPLQSIRAMRAMLAPVIGAMTGDLRAACRGADALACLAVFAGFGRAIAESQGLPQINFEPTPVLPTAAFPAAGWPVQANLGGWLSRLSGVAMLHVIWQWYRPFVNDFRQGLGLPAYSGRQFIDDLRRTPLVGAYSPRVIPPPGDWPATARVTGYFWLEGEDWQPPAALEAFLAAGRPPVYVGFGSMAGRDPAQTASLALEALALSGQRGVLVTGWGGLRAGSVPANVLVLAGAPHARLFPRMAAVVHHGGAGTTAEGLRAGVPAVVVPFIVDQRFWGARVRALGAGPRPIPRKALTARKLAAAIDRAVHDEAMRARAERLGAALRAEDGLGAAVSVIRQCLGPP
jgi:UDP:flavonoid glycosyltransferase YjiC (YdhE family)